MSSRIMGSSSATATVKPLLGEALSRDGTDVLSPSDWSGLSPAKSRPMASDSSLPAFLDRKKSPFTTSYPSSRKSLTFIPRSLSIAEFILSTTSIVPCSFERERKLLTSCDGVRTLMPPAGVWVTSLTVLKSSESFP